MDKRRSILNISVSVGFKITTMLMVIFVKRFLIQICGNEVNGLNSLYMSIIGFLSVAELGVGGAISFCMYKPIVEKNLNKVTALYHLFRRIYFLVGIIILLVGLALVPVIHFFAKDYAQLDVNLHITFVLMLVSVVITYGYGAQTALINAHKNNYITAIIFSGGIVVQYAMQIAVLILTHSFEGFLMCRIVSAIIQGIATEVVAWKKYTHILTNKQVVDQETKVELTRSIKAMFMHKVGYLLVNTADSIIISIFIGVLTLGKYSNYATILTAMTNVVALVFSSLTSVLGHLYVEVDNREIRKYSEAFHTLNFLLATIFFLGYYATIDNLIAIFFTSELVADRSISFVITLNGFVQFLRRSVLTFRDATGTFYHDRWKPLLEGVVNVILSILFVNWFGVTGIIAATIVTNLFICDIIEPYVLYRNAFCVSPKRYYAKNYFMIIAFTGIMIIMEYCMNDCSNDWLELVVNGGISLGISVIVCLAALFADRVNISYIMKKINGR